MHEFYLGIDGRIVLKWILKEMEWERIDYDSPGGS
jgi:hypothetical protein